MATIEQLRLRDSALEPVAEKVLTGGRLDRDDGLLAATTDDLVGVGRLANLVRERLHGDTTYYNINRHLNPTNVCVASCDLCAFYVPWRERDEGWTYTVDQAVEIAARDVDESVSELHIVGGLHPKLLVEYYEDLFRTLKKRFPWIHLKALTMVELDFIAKASRLDLEELIARLRDAGLDSCPGGGAEIFADRVRNEICDHKTDGPRWLEIARTVHTASIPSNCTMLYGHVETAEERVDHLLALRELQDETGGFQCLIPLAKIAQVALHFGANDLDGTIVDERITHAAGGTAGTGMARQRLERLITEAGRVPVLRDTLYRPIKETSVVA
jgi:aminodeoxyfutalosine synthase